MINLFGYLLDFINLDLHERVDIFQVVVPDHYMGILVMNIPSFSKLHTVHLNPYFYVLLEPY